MRILWVATKAPWPPVDGGRLLLAKTLEALAAAGHDLTLVAPTAPVAARDRSAEDLCAVCRPVLVPVRRHPPVLDALRAQLRRSPLTVVRHGLPAVRDRVAELLRTESFDLAQAEQVQALGSLEPAFERSLPVVLRAQNVESDLWARTAELETWRRPPLALEARRLAAWEGRAVRRCAATVALTAEDADRLAALSGAAGKVHAVPAPFEEELPAADALPGSPAVVLFGSAGWRPNARGAAWFLRRVWPRVLGALPAARLHVFGKGAGGPGTVSHPPPADSRDAYPAGAAMAVPLAVASGVRIKILEAWARGLPVVATPEAARGLDARDGEHLLLAGDGEAFAAALGRLHREPNLAATLVANGRRRLRERHAPARVAERLAAICASVCEMGRLAS